MRYIIEKHDRYVVIEPLIEKLDGDSASKLKGEILLRNTGGQRNFVFDMKNIEEADESGIRMGLVANRICRSSGGLFILVNLQEKVIDFTKMIGLDNYFLVAEDHDSAAELILQNELRSDLED